MKIFSFILATCFIVSSCIENLKESLPDSKTFSSNSSMVGAHSTMTITYTGKEVTAKRSFEKFDPTETYDNAVFLEANVRTSKTPEGGLKIEALNQKLWFIPFLLASEPIELSGEHSVLYYCSCKGYPINEAGRCSIYESPSYISCAQDVGECNSICRGFSMKMTGPDQKPMDDPFNTHTGGVIVAAEKVRVIDPDGTVRAEGMVFYETESGGLMKLEDARKLNLIK